MQLDFTIRPGISPIDRGQLEDRVVEALGNDADCLGGGGMLDGSECDFSIEVDGLTIDEALAACHGVFGDLEFSRPTTVVLQIGSESFTLPTGLAH